MRVRVQVTAPGEVPIVYPKGQEPQNKTPLRELERKLKKRQLDGCIDTRNPLSHPLVHKVGDHVFGIGETGCMFIPGALSLQEQLNVVSQVFLHCFRWFSSDFLF